MDCGELPQAPRDPQMANGSTKIELEPDVALWLERCVEKGFTAPTWPTEFGGGGLSAELAKVLYEEMGKANARTPLTGMGMTMIGPTPWSTVLRHRKNAYAQDHSWRAMVSGIF